MASKGRVNARRVFLVPRKIRNCAAFLFTCQWDDLRSHQTNPTHLRCQMLVRLKALLLFASFRRAQLAASLCTSGFRAARWGPLAATSPQTRVVRACATCSGGERSMSTKRQSPRAREDQAPKATGKRPKVIERSTPAVGAQDIKGDDSPPEPVVNADDLIGISRRLHDRLKDKTWRGTSKQPVACSYNVLEYASEPNEAYTREYGGGRTLGRAFVVGMNPGPWGMVQTGVPFGEVGYVRDWLGVRGEVGRPSKEHAKRRVEGFACQRSEVSGKRLWGFFKKMFGTADAWGDSMFVYNYCPLTFMSSSGGNITPDKLPPTERERMEDACGEALAAMMLALQPSVVIGVGKFAGFKCLQAVKASGLGAGDDEVAVEVVVVNHPSPASPTGIKWEKATCMDELVLGSSASKEIDRFLA